MISKGCPWILLFYLFVLRFERTKSDDQFYRLNVNRYRYTSQAIFHYVPSKILDRTRLTISADVLHHREKDSCRTSFVQLFNVTIEPMPNDLDTTQLTKEIQKIFDDIHRQQCSERTNDDINEKNLHISFLNHFLPNTVKNCTTSFDPFGQHLQKSLCRLNTAGLLTIERQLIFDRTIDQIQLKRTTTKSKKNMTDVESLLQQICLKDDSNVIDELSILIENELDHKFLTRNIRTYSTCTRKWFLQAIIKVHRPEITEFLLHQDDLSIIDKHLNYLENKIDDSIRNVLKNVLNSSRKFSEFLQLRLLLLIDDDQTLLNFALNSTHRLDYRCVALRSLKETNRFYQDFETLFNDEDESNEIRLIAFENLRSSSFNVSNIEQIQSKQIRFYLKSLSKESSLWLGQSGSYEFPFGTINVIFNEIQTSFLPNVVQFNLKKKLSIDFYRLKPHEEILIVTNRTSIERFATFNDFLQWIFKDRSVELSTLDGFLLHVDLQFKWFDGNYRPWRNIFQKSTADITSKIYQGLGQIRTGFLLRFHLESNFQIHIRENSTSTSYLWFAKQKENTLFKIEQRFHPLFLQSEILRKEFHSSTPKDFCYVVPHFDSKLCFTLMFDRLWSSSMAVRILSDDPSLVYNLTRYNETIDFHIQHHQQPIRSMQFQHRYDEQIGLLSHAELATSIDRFDFDFHWQNDSRMTCQLIKNHNEIINASGTYDYDAMRGISLNLTDILPRHLGQIFIAYTKSLTSINVQRWRKLITNLSDWQRIRFDVEMDQAFLFFKEHLSIDLYLNLKSFSFYVTFERNQQSKFQFAFIDEPSFFHQSLSINSSLIEFDYQTEIHYEDVSNLNIQSSSTINSWSWWNVSYAAKNASRIDFQLNQWFGHLQIGYPRIEFAMNVSHMNLFRWNFQRKEEKKIEIVIESPTSTYQIDGEILGHYTDLRLDLPIIENHKIKSDCQINLFSDSNSSIFNVTVNYRSIVLLRFTQSWTFLHRFLFRSETDLNVDIIKDSLLSFRSLIVFIENSTRIRYSNGSFHLPSLFVSKPLHWNYENPYQWFIQLFQWAKATQTGNTMELTTNFGLRVFTIKSILTRISIGFEQILFGHRFEFFLEIDRHWTISLLVNRRIRYEFKSIVAESSFRLTQTNIQTNQTRQLLINYHTDDQTLLRFEVLFSKYFSSFVNDFVIDLSLRNQTMKFLLHIPLFKKEFYSITWKRIVSKRLFHFQGNLQSYFLRRRRLFHYDYDWHLDSFNHWTFDSRLSLFSSDPIQSNLNITNNYLWSGQYVIDYRLFIDNRRDLIRLHHEYVHVRPISKIFVDLYLMSQNYLLDVNYSQINYSIEGFFKKNQRQHPLNGFWNSTSQTLQLNTDEIKSMTIITMSLIKSLIDRDDDERIGFLIETKRTESFTNDSELLQCNPYLIIQRRPRFFAIHYYTLNDGLTSMIYQWTSHSYFSWNFTGHGRSLVPLRKLEYDLRKNYLVRFHTTTYQYFAHYHIEKQQMTFRRIPVAEDADDCFDLRTRLFSNQTFFFHLQAINNHYRIIASPTGEQFSWALHGYFRHDSFNGSLIISRSDWWFSSHLNFNSSIYVSTGSYVQLVSRSDPQFALEIRWKNQSHFVIQYAGWQSLFALKILFPFWNIDFLFTSQSTDTKLYQLNFKLNSQIDRTFSLLIDDEQFSLQDPNEEFQINGSSKEFLFRHSLENETTQFNYNADTIKIFTNHFGIFISNRTSETSRYIRLYHHQWKLNLTVFYYKSGRFHFDRSTFQTPIYDIHILHHPTDEENRYVKIILELLPLQSSAFSLVRGRAFRIGYQTEKKQMILEGNLGFTVEDLTHPRIILMNERWKFIYGYRKQDRLFIRWNLRLDSLNKTVHGRVTFQDPNDQFSSSIYSDVRGYIHDSFLFAKIRTFYASTTNDSQTIDFDVRIDTRVTREQNLSIDLLHELSETNLSLSIDHYPERKVQISLKPNRLSELETLLHLYANRTESQIYLLVVLRDFIHLNLTLPKSYPETGLLYSALFMNDDEYFDAKFEGSGLKLRTKEYLLNLSLTQFNLVDRNNDQTIASIISQWLERNSSTGLITIVTPKSYPRKFVTTDSLTNQPTWLTRFRQYFIRNQFAIEFNRDLRNFFDQWKQDFIREHERFSEHFFDAIKFDEDVQLTLEQINSTLVTIINTCFQLGFDIENVIQEYMNNLTCLTYHRDLFYRNFTDVTNVAIESVIYQLVVHVNRTSTILNHFTHYPRSIGVLISYLINEIILEIYKEFSQFYLESKRYMLRKILEYSNDMELVINLSSLVFKSLTILASKDLQTLFSFINERFRRIIQLWMNSPVEYKLMRTVASQLIEWTDRIRFYLDDRFDFLLPDLRIYTPRFELNNLINQTFLFSWSKESNHSEHH